MKIGFDNDKYLKMQSEHIKERIAEFGGKLYLEFGGKLFDDYHASRVLPGFKPDSKLQMLLQFTDQAEMIFVVNANDIENSKVREDLGISYDSDVLRLIDEYKKQGLYVSSVVITRYRQQRSCIRFQEKLEKIGIKVYHHFTIDNYPSDVQHIISDDGFGKNDYIETERPLVVVTAPGPGSGKMSTCLSQLYHENKRGILAGYAKYETFPIWNLPLDHPVNLAYEAATADLNDINMIDPFHLSAYGKTTVNYNRDVEIFPVLNSMFMEIYGKSPYKSPTDMGVNMAGNCIVDDEVTREASKQEIIRRYFNAVIGVAEGKREVSEIEKIKLLMSQLGIDINYRKVVKAARDLENETDETATAIELDDGMIITGKTGNLLGPSAGCIVNAIKYLAGIEKEKDILSPDCISAIQTLKIDYFNSKNPRLHPDEVLIALSTNACSDEIAKLALSQLPKLKGCQVHTTAALSETDRGTFKKLGCVLTFEPKGL